MACPTDRPHSANTWLTDAEDDALRLLAYKLRESRATVMRVALMAYAEQHLEPEPKPAPKPPRSMRT